MFIPERFYKLPDLTWLPTKTYLFQESTFFEASTCCKPFYNCRKSFRLYTPLASTGFYASDTPNFQAVPGVNTSTGCTVFSCTCRHSSSSRFLHVANLSSLFGWRHLQLPCCRSISFKNRPGFARRYPQQALMQSQLPSSTLPGVNTLTGLYPIGANTGCVRHRRIEWQKTESFHVHVLTDGVTCFDPLLADASSAPCLP